MRRRRPFVAAVALAIMLSAVSSSSYPAGSIKYYKVRQGDTLWRLAAKNGTSVNSIARANGISEKAILSVGKTIAIPTKYTPSQKGRALTQARRSAGQQHQTALAPSTQQASATDAQTAPQASPNTELVRTALALQGARYSRGGTSRSGFDCSGFTRYIYAKYGISLPHSSSAQARVGTAISRASLQQGDLVFFHTYRSGISHVGIYVGNGRFVHASTHRGGVRVDALSHPYYATRYRGARRIR